jgi:TRAP-type C4-dicarboxylate transport system substrate-binding protein
MNKGKWNSLSPDIQKIFNEVSLEILNKQTIIWNEIDIEGREVFKGAGGQIIPLSDAEAARWTKAVEPVISDYKKLMISKGFKDTEVDGWVSFIRERIEYWKSEEKKRGVPAPFQ